MPKLPAPVIVVPGITASYLRDEYILPPEIVWSVMTNDFPRIALHPDNPARLEKHPRGLWYEREQPARVRSDQVFEVAYKELISELRYNLADRPDRPVPVYPFGYDWRQPLDAIEAQLAEFIDEVIERTCLLRHYDADGYSEDPKVSLVGHSMGGMVIAGCLQTLKGKARVAKVATLAAPFRGSFEAILKIAAGTADLGTGSASSREREVARLMPALYHLIPSCADDADFADGLPKTFFDPAAWQPSIIGTIAEFIRQYGLSQTARLDQAAELFQAFLDAAAAHRARVEKLRLADAGLAPEDWLCVVGVDASQTRVRVPVVLKGGKPEFVLRSADRMNQWPADAPPVERELTGDGTVPFRGAVPAFLAPANLVCVTPDDYSYWEVQDRVLSSTSGFHGILPNMDMLHRLIVRHFTGRADTHGNTWGRRAPGVVQWDPPLKLTEK